VFSQHLDRSKPLWEIWMVEGLDDDRWALLSKVHHCMVDGVAATDMMSLMFGETPEPTNGEVWQPDPEPSGLDLIAYSARHRIRDPAAQIRFALRAPTEVLRAVAGGARAVAAAAPAFRPATSSLTGPIGPHRVWSWAKVPLAAVKEVRAGLGGTVNDVVLTLITNGYRELLDARGEPISADTVIRTMVPVSVRSPGERGQYNNRVSAVFARLPVGMEDPAERLGAIREQMDGIKSSKQAVAGDALVQLSGFAPPMLLALGSRVATRSARLNMDTATTNVPGPQHALQTLDRTLIASYPYVPVVGTIRIVVAIFSYDGQLYFGVTGDRDHAPDVDVLTRGIEDDAERLRDRSELAPA
jgi:WS/DGAT/MGAT family acyltransferase